MDKPLISIILPVKNSERTLLSCLGAIESLVLPKELIVVLGSSTDNTARILDQYKQLISKVVNDEGEGVYAAMNQALNEADGDWLYFIGSDDKIEARTFEEMMQLRDNKAKILFGNVSYVNRNHPSVPEVHKAAFDWQLYWKNSLHHQGTVYHRSLFQEQRFNTDYKVLADYDLNLFFFQQKIKAAKYNGIICECGAAGLSKHFRWSLYKEELRIKWKRLPLLWAMLNSFWIVLKYFYKRLLAEV